ncbi:MAG: hypothetical protein AB7Y46_00245 [Armatimonadota bacterium]
MRTLALMALAATWGLPAAAQQAQTILRHDNFLAFEAAVGETVEIAVESIPKASFVYADDLLVEVIDSTSERRLRRMVRLGEAERIRYAVQTAGLHAVRISAGWNTCSARIVDRPWALVAWEDVPLSICGSMAPLHFRVPDGVERFRVTVLADVTGEGAALRIWGPDGALVLEQIDDFDQQRRLDIQVPEGSDGKVWSLTVTDPQREGLVLDDVTLYLSGRVPPLLCVDPAWAEGFAAGEQYQPDLIDRAIEVGGSFAIPAGETATATWQMDALPENKVYALRITASDVDYPRELVARINGGAPIAIPMTGNETADTFTLLIEREQLRVGENVLELTQDPGGGSAAVAAREIQILIGDRIRQYAGY